MKLIDIIGSQPGRVLRALVGAGIITAGLRRRDSRGAVMVAAGAVPLAAGAADVCMLGPLVRGPLHGAAFRQHRSSR